MANKGVKYLNGLVIVSIIFALISGIPLGILSGLAITTGGSYSNQEVNIGANGQDLIMLDADSNARTFLVYWIYGTSPDFEVYIMDHYQYDNWINSNDTLPQNYDVRSSNDDVYRLLEDRGDHYMLVVNHGSNNLHLSTHYISTLGGFLIASGVLAVIFSFFIIIIILNTIGYFIKYLIIWPITGAGRSTSYDSDSKKLERYERKKDRYDYKYVTSATPSSSRTTATPKTKTEGVAVTKTATSIPSTVPRKRVPAANAIGNYVVAGQTKRYDNKSDFVNGFIRAWDHTNIPERVLGILALFFFVLGLVTTSWFLIVVMPITFIGIAVIVFFANRNTTEKLIRTVESYQAIYVRDASRILNTSSELLRMNVWKIIRLGLAPIGYDAENGVLFDVTKVDPSKTEKLTPAAQSIHEQLVAEVDKKEEKKEESVVSAKEIKCPFCDGDNPPDSLFCIKCGASLKPAK